MHGCKNIHICKGLYAGEWPWRSLKVIGISDIRQVTHHFLLSVYSNHDYLAPFSRYYHMYRVRDCPWHWEVLHFIKKQLKLQTTCAFLFICRHIVFNTCYIFQGMGVRTGSNCKSDLRCYSMSWALMSFDRPHTISY